MVKGCGKKLEGDLDVFYLDPETGVYTTSWIEETTYHPRLYDVPHATCGSIGLMRGNKVRLCIPCAKKRGLLW
jgi:hypothetical protein